MVSIQVSDPDPSAFVRGRQGVRLRHARGTHLRTRTQDNKYRRTHTSRTLTQKPLLPRVPSTCIAVTYPLSPVYHAGARPDIFSDAETHFHQDGQVRDLKLPTLHARTFPPVFLSCECIVRPFSSFAVEYGGMMDEMGHNLPPRQRPDTGPDTVVGPCAYDPFPTTVVLHPTDQLRSEGISEPAVVTGERGERTVVNAGQPAFDVQAVVPSTPSGLGAFKLDIPEILMGMTVWHGRVSPLFAFVLHPRALRRYRVCEPPTF